MKEKKRKHKASVFLFLFLILFLFLFLFPNKELTYTLCTAKEGCKLIKIIPSFPTLFY